jgi:hypothetical protein
MRSIRRQTIITRLQRKLDVVAAASLFHTGARRPSTCWDGEAGTYPGLIQATRPRLVQARPGTPRHVPRLVPRPVLRLNQASGR